MNLEAAKVTCSRAIWLLIPWRQDLNFGLSELRPIKNQSLYNQYHKFLLAVFLFYLILKYPIRTLR